jgi:energy-coupling factor transporter transmembrane protein EcfT
MHPVIRILCLLIAAAFLARGSWLEVGALACGLLVLSLAVGQRDWRRFLRTVRRLRFLLLSIAIVYGWFTPGQPLWPALGRFTPTGAGIEQGLLRVAALVVLVGAVQLLLETTARPQFVAALRWWLRPLRALGLAPERVALRIVLALEAVPKLRQIVAASRAEDADAPRVRRVAAIANSAFAATLAAAERAELPVVAVPKLAPPAPVQWLAPLALTSILLVV